jgi:hypothetical protein
VEAIPLAVNGSETQNVLKRGRKNGGQESMLLAVVLAGKLRRRATARWNPEKWYAPKFGRAQHLRWPDQGNYFFAGRKFCCECAMQSPL